MTDGVGDEQSEREVDHGATADARRSLRDMGALLALPALWVDHEPGEIATGLLSVLFGILRLNAAYARFNGTDGDPPLEIWRPSGAAMPPDLRSALQFDGLSVSGISTTEFQDESASVLRIARVPIALPWETGLVIVSARRPTFPTDAEAHLLRVAIGQGAIAIHAARRHLHERLARIAAEEMVERQNELLRTLADTIEPSLLLISRRVRDATRLASEIDELSAAQVTASGGPAVTEARDTAAPSPLPLTRRELEVLGLLAQGLSNKEIAGVMWLSDRTVERHITSVYRKIGVARRSEATAFALRNGVVQWQSDQPKVKQ